MRDSEELSGSLRKASDEILSLRAQNDHRRGAATPDTCALTDDWARRRRISPTSAAPQPDERIAAVTSTALSQFSIEAAQAAQSARTILRVTLVC